MNAINDEREGLPSASDSAFWNCAGKQNLMKVCGYPKLPDSPDSLRGDRIHAAFQTGNTLMLEEEEEDTYKQGLKFMQLLLDSWQAQNNLAGYVEGPREERLWFHDDATLSPLASAKLDRHYVSNRVHALIVDLKSGWVPNLIPSPRSTQLRLQLVCLKDELPDLEWIRVAFAKAKLTHGYHDYCDYGPDDIRHAQEWVRQHIWLSHQLDAPRTPGKHCDYCPVKAWCVEAGAYSLLPTVIAAQAAQKPIFDPDVAVAQMDPVDLVKVWQSSGLITKILDAVKARLKSMSDDNLALLGLGRAKGRENHGVTDISRAVLILQALGWSLEQIYSCMDFSNTKLAAEARRVKGFGNDKDATAWVRSELAETITKTTSEAPIKEL